MAWEAGLLGGGEFGRKRGSAGSPTLQLPALTMDTYPILSFFEFEHLPEHLQAVSKPLCELAHEMAGDLPACPETSAGLRKLLEAKDCFVRAQLSGS